MSSYRLRVALTYTTSANAASALTAVNAALVANGRTEVASRTGNDVNILVPAGLTEAEATSLQNALIAAANVGAKSGKVSTVRTPL